MAAWASVRSGLLNSLIDAKCNVQPRAEVLFTPLLFEPSASVITFGSCFNLNRRWDESLQTSEKTRFMYMLTCSGGAQNFCDKVQW
jgi:hypothetical protein